MRESVHAGDNRKLDGLESNDGAHGIDDGCRRNAIRRTRNDFEPQRIDYSTDDCAALKKRELGCELLLVPPPNPRLLGINSLSAPSLSFTSEVGSDDDVRINIIARPSKRGVANRTTAVAANPPQS